MFSWRFFLPFPFVFVALLLPSLPIVTQIRGGHKAGAPVAYQIILEPGIGQFREFEPRRVHTRRNLLGLPLVHKLTCRKRELATLGE